MNVDKQLFTQVKKAFEEFAGRKVRNKVIEVTVRHVQDIKELNPSLTTEEVIDQAIMKTIKDGMAF
ncbi:hypothetical protein [Aneurinibacillus aneurinilyticus]|nr:hypothetical protein [Aneurinibacillus aneurinilyticus]MCI1695543.1 hypothetical protein [Aneurinibacillus aneurinilyticus]MED0673066.1 hypothetical protein [Aneurinibacillus aneurinilyticus]MED0706932.1 hypothetical protein [Aneurinibacillus aneurinilyticus]MED0721970.1 hypothetical protein [Aneurinibacillus aneurinilyticus]MED0731189.1 hypothetical protein [Aneurinibacillus aneurinilyticus]